MTVLEMKSPVITRSVVWRAGWMLTNWGQLRWIIDRIFQWRRHRYHRWWQLISLWVTVLVIKSLFSIRIHLLPTLIVPCSTFVMTTNTLWTQHDEHNMILWWCCVPIILFVDGPKKVGANFLVRQLQSCLSFSTRNKIEYKILSEYNSN